MTEPTADARNNGSTTDFRDDRGRFTLGNPGRPVGARHKTTLAVEAILEGEAEALTRKAVQLAKEGDASMVRLCLDRIAPVSRSRTVRLDDFPAIDTAADVSAAMRALFDRLAAGELSTGEAAEIGALLETKRRSIETELLEARLKRIEESLALTDAQVGHNDRR